MAFRVLIIGGTGQVGAAVVRALVAEPSCAEVVMVNRKTTPLPPDNRLRQVCWRRERQQALERGGVEGSRTWGRRWFCPWLP
jgi:uncharacterized protein YbjT (DUF2867 family)